MYTPLMSDESDRVDSVGDEDREDEDREDAHPALSLLPELDVRLWTGMYKPGDI